MIATRAPINRLAVWLILFAVGLATMLALNPAPAQAAPPIGQVTTVGQVTTGAQPLAGLFDCKDASAPTSPGDQGPARFGAHAAQEPTGGDPFAANSTTSVYREYGWITTWWPTYDLGCGPEIARAPGAVIGSYCAELIAMSLLVGATGFDALIHAVINWTGLSWVDNALNSIVADLRDSMWTGTLTFVGLLIACWFIIAVVRGDMAQVAKAAAWTSFGAMALAVVVNYPAKTSQFFDSTVKATIAAAYGGDGVAGGKGDSNNQIADGIVANVYQSVVYDRWCEGMVGGNKQAADRWCPRLWKSLYLSRAEAARPNADREDIVKHKMDDFTDIANEMQDKDPSAYQVLQGKNYQERLFAAGSATLIWPIILIYPIWSLFVLLVALMLLRVMVLIAPVAGPFLLHPSAREAGRGVLKLCGGALINAVVFCLASAIYLRVVQTVLASDDANLLVRLASLLVLTIAFWIATKPWRRMTTMGRGLGAHINKLADDKLAASTIARKATRVAYMAVQLQTMGRAAAGANKAGEAAGQVAESVDRLENQPPPLAPLP